MTRVVGEDRPPPPPPPPPSGPDAARRSARGMAGASGGAGAAGREGGGREGGGRAAVTRAALLRAARDVFAAAGFTDAAVADVVARADASVGSLYHHFGGKADLYLALFEDYQAGMEARAATAVAHARHAGETDPMTLFIVGARAYLHGCWEERDLARLFLAGGGPPGFDLAARRRYREWTRLNGLLLHADDAPRGDALVLVLTTVLSEAGHEVALCDGRDAAEQLAADVLVLVERVGRP